MHRRYNMKLISHYLLAVFRQMLIMHQCVLHLPHRKVQKTHSPFASQLAQPWPTFACRSAPGFYKRCVSVHVALLSTNMLWILLPKGLPKAQTGPRLWVACTQHTRPTCSRAFWQRLQDRRGLLPSPRDCCWRIQIHFKSPI